MVPVVGFIVCALIIFVAGQKLSYYGEALADLTGMGRAWTGLILMASVTSLPELMVGISSAAWVQSADLAVGDIMGSCAFNLGLLALLDAFTPKHKPLLSSSSQNHVVAAALGLILVAMAGLGIVLPEDIILTPSIGVTSVLFLLVYLLSIRIIFKYNRDTSEARFTGDEAHHQTTISLSKATFMYLLYASVIVAAALALPHQAEEIALMTGLGESFVSTLFLAISTSLPEIAVSIAAVRSGAIDLAVGNLLGSNIFNIFILFIDDLVYTKGQLLKDASDLNAVSVFAVILMSAVAIIGLTVKVKGKRFLLAYDALIIFIIYVTNMIILYRLS
jgi:cation:H+ antiporter